MPSWLPLVTAQPEIIAHEYYRRRMRSDAVIELSDVQRVDLYPDRLVGLPGTEHPDAAPQTRGQQQALFAAGPNQHPEHWHAGRGARGAAYARRQIHRSEQVGSVRQS